MKLKVLIIGASGQVGGAIFEVFKKNKGFEVIGADKIISKDILFLDITDKEGIESFFKKINPKVVILPAALANVDLCEKEKDLAFDVNVKGAENVVLASKKNSAKLIYISTAYVFNGEKGNYKEENAPNPINYYAETKLEAERIIERELNNYLIIRTNWVFDLGYDQKNFIVRLLDSLRKGEPVKVPKDQYGNPTLARNIAWAIEELIKKNKKGIYHIVGRDKMNKYEWAQRVAKYFNLDHNLIIPVSSKELKQIAKRPLKNDLNILKAENELEIKMLSLDEALRFLKSNNPKINSN